MVRFESKSSLKPLVCSCRIIIPLYVYESKYFNCTCSMKIIRFFPDGPADKGIFANVSDVWSLHMSEKYLHSKKFSFYFRCQQFFQHLFKHMPKKNRSYIRFWSRDSHVIIGTSLTGFESAADVLTQIYCRSSFTRRIKITKAAVGCL